MVIRQYVDKLEGDDFLHAQAMAWRDIREFMEEDIMPLVAQAPGGSVNGPGSSLGCTEPVVAQLPALLHRYDVKTMLDVGCGDWTWMRHVDLTGIDYTGWDVDITQVSRNRSKFPAHRFDSENILTVEDMPRYDVILCRDVLAHLPTEHILAALAKFKASGCRYLLASTYPGADNAFDYRPEHYAWLGYCEHPVDLQERPFALAEIECIEETPGPGGVIALPHELGLFRL
jgi:SAM-dependent methyltransferase